MGKIINFIKKYKIYILSTLLFLFMVRSCQNSNQAKKMNKKNVELTEINDSIIELNNRYSDTISKFSKVLRQQKFEVLSKYDDFISKQDRGPQLMQVHMMIKQDIKDLQK
jgi:hypothetical protein